MADTYTSLLRLRKQETGSNTDTWGSLLNTSVVELVEKSISGTVQIVMAGADVALSTNAGTDDQARNMIVQLVGTPGGSYNITVPATSKVYIFVNDTANTHTIKTSSGVVSVGIGPGITKLVVVTTTGVREPRAPSSYFVGQVMMFSGSPAALTGTGFSICDGTNGTPDLRSRFIIGAGSTYVAGATGGAASSGAGATTAAGATAASVTGDHTLIATEVPAPALELFVWYASGGSDSNVDSFNRPYHVSIAGELSAGGAYASVNQLGDPLIRATGGGVPVGHNHTIPGVVDHTHATPDVATIPPYYALYYVMYTG
jgi:hypothetical protein